MLGGFCLFGVGLGYIAAMQQITWKLPSYLKAHNISNEALRQQAGGSGRRIDRLARQAPDLERLDLPTLANIISALRTLTGEPVTVADLLEYHEAPSEQPLQALDAVDHDDLDDDSYTSEEETAAILNDPEMMERIRQYEEQKANGTLVLIPLEVIAAEHGVSLPKAYTSRRKATVL
jgi:hypothetical protein